jgi:hypothetical protein
MNKSVEQLKILVAMSAAVRHVFSFWVVIADLDNFKVINDTYGRDAGIPFSRSLLSIHPGHLHVGNNDRKWAVLAEQYQTIFPARGGHNVGVA